MVETSNGVIFVENYSLSNVEVLGVQEEGFEVSAYDFIAHGIAPSTMVYSGLIFCGSESSALT
jgi:hypothetical protein